VELNGDYHAGIAFAANTLTGVETLKLDAGHSYALDFTNASVPDYLTVDASALTSSDQLNFTDNSNAAYYFNIIGGQGNDTIKLKLIGVYSHIDLSQGGDDTFVGDPDLMPSIYMGAALTSADRISNAGIELNGDYSQGFTFDSQTLNNVRGIAVDGSYTY